MKRIICVLLVLVLLLTGTAALASDTSNAKYKTVITITNSGTALTNAVATFNLSTSALIAGNMLSDNASDCAMLTGTGGSDIVFMPSVNATYPWVTWVSAIGEAAQAFQYLFTKDVTGGQIAYFPGAAGMTVPNDATLELGNDFVLNLEGYFNFDAAGDYLSKLAAFSFTPGTNNATFSFPQDINVSDNLTTGDTLSTSAYNSNQKAQSFTASVTYDVEAFAFKMLRAGNPSSANVTIYAADGAHKPTGGTLAQGEVPGIGSITTGAAGEWVVVPFATTARLINGTQYVAVVTVDGSAADYLAMRYDATATAYAGGSYIYSTDNGSTWTIDANKDYLFKSGNLSSVDLTVTSMTAGEYKATVNMTSPFVALAMDRSATLPVSDNLVMNLPAWQVEEYAAPGGTFTTIDDNQFTATNTAATWGNIGYSFNGATSLIDLGNDAALFPNQSTWELWIRRGATVGFDHIMSCDAAGNTNGDATLYINGGTNKLEYSIYNGAAIVIQSNSALTQDTWYHVFIITSGAGTFMYVGDTQQTSSSASTLAPNANQNLILGSQRPAATNPFLGDLGLARIYDKALTQTEITQNDNATKWKYDGSTDMAGYSTLTSIPDNSNDIVIAEAAAMPYMTSADITVGGSLVGSWEWEYAETFTDLSGNGNTATPTFRTSPTDADLSAEAGAIECLVTSSTPTSGTTGGWTMIDGVPTSPTGLFTEGGSDFPIGPEITDTADAMGQNQEAWLFFFAFGLAFLALVLVYGATHNTRTGQRGSLLLACTSAELVLIVFYMMETVPGWCLIPFGLFAVLLVMWRRSPSPVD